MARVVAVVGLVLLTGALRIVTGGLRLAGAGDEPLRVVVAGRLVRVGGRHPTVDSALRRARISARDGVLYSAGSHRALDEHAAPWIAYLDGVAVAHDAPVRNGSRVDVVDGPDGVEPVDHTQQPTSTGGGLPDVERDLWYPGTPGVDEVTTGRVSGEVVDRQPVVPVGPARQETGPVVALTFDDGPDAQWTAMILQILHDEGVHATFCVVGIQANHYPDLVRREFAEGHRMCDHTLHHILDLPRRPPSQIVDEINGGADLLRRLTGQDPALYRPPGGALSPQVVDVAHRRGLRVLHWSIDPADYRKPPPDVILHRILDHIRPGAVILMHDGGGDRSRTVAMLRTLIDELKKRGYGFATP